MDTTDDKRKNRIITIEETQDLFNDDDLPELNENEYDINQQGLKELFDDNLEEDK